MSTTIARVYESYGDALDASNELKTKGFRDRSIDLISKASNVSSVAAENFSTEIGSAGIPSDDVPALATAVDEGKSLLVVRAGWGMAVKAMKVTGRHNPSDAREYYVPEFVVEGSKSTTVSTSVSFLVSSWLNIPLLISGASPFSSMFGWRVLIDDAAPLSRMLNWPTLKNGFTFGEPKLKQGFTFGEPKLSSSATVFSDALNLPVLAKGPEK